MIVVEAAVHGPRAGRLEAFGVAQVVEVMDVVVFI